MDLKKAKLTATSIAAVIAFILGTQVNAAAHHKCYKHCTSSTTTTEIPTSSTSTTSAIPSTTEEPATSTSTTSTQPTVEPKLAPPASTVKERELRDHTIGGTDPYYPEKILKLKVAG